jgi:hypothetical protein
MSLYNPTRDQVRQFFFDSWGKFKQRLPLSDLEKIAIDVMHQHPEYHVMLDAPERYLNQQYFPEMGETNPFLHMSLHLSVIEQINIDQPIGIRAVYDQLCQRHATQGHNTQESIHYAQHEIVECLAETIWQSQRNQTPLDSESYLKLLHSRIA